MREYKLPPKKVKAKPTNNINDFKDCKFLYSLKKEHSPQTIAIFEDPDDDWFVYFKWYQTKSGKITDSEIITKADLEDRLDRYERLGYIIEKINV